MIMDMAFRTECKADAEGVPALLKELGCIMYKSQEPEGPLGTVIFNCKIDCSDLESLRAKMRKLIENDERFIDMHRCYQTLNVGSEPDEDWFKRS